MVDAAVIGEDAGDVAVVDHVLEGVAFVCRDGELGDGGGALLVAHGFKEAAGGVQRAVSGVGEREGQGGDEGEEVFFHGFWFGGDYIRPSVHGVCKRKGCWQRRAFQRSTTIFGNACVSLFCLAARWAVVRSAMVR